MGLFRKSGAELRGTRGPGKAPEMRSGEGTGRAAGPAGQQANQSRSIPVCEENGDLFRKFRNSLRD